MIYTPRFGRRFYRIIADGIKIAIAGSKACLAAIFLFVTSVDIWYYCWQQGP